MTHGESPTPDRQELIERFADDYRLGQAEVVREIERRVCGCDYGGTSWTTREEARRLGRLLGLAPGVRLLEVGAGSGWPGLYLATTTGCDVVLADLPLDGLKIATARATTDGLDETCRAAVADGAALPFAAGCFDAILHSDVLCCLEPKLAVLKECRRVLQPGGTMVFTVIFIAPELSPGDRALAAASGPPVIEAAASYAEMLHEAGWQITSRAELTAEYGASLGHLIGLEEAHEAELRDLRGDAGYLEKLGRRQQSLAAVEQGLIRREMFSAV
ncbi:MAG: class I SAM-dependent methyltransferase [Alphaproteobacteria bacterium]